MRPDTVSPAERRSSSPASRGVEVEIVDAHRHARREGARACGRLRRAAETLACARPGRSWCCSARVRAVARRNAAVSRHRGLGTRAETRRRRPRLYRSRRRSGRESYRAPGGGARRRPAVVPQAQAASPNFWPNAGPRCSRTRRTGAPVAGQNEPHWKHPQAKLNAAIKSARDIMRKDAGLNGDLDRIPQLAWLLFLRAFDASRAATVRSRSATTARRSRSRTAGAIGRPIRLRAARGGAARLRQRRSCCHTSAG